MPARVDANLAKSIISPSLKYVLLDIDGVLWSGKHVIDGVPETLDYLRNKCKKNIRFLSNNASLSRRELLQNFIKKGLTDVKEHEIYNSGYAAALKLQQLLGEQREGEDKPLVHGNVFVIGEQGLHEELQKVLAPGFITYGLELHDGGINSGGYNGDKVASAWRDPVLPPPIYPLEIKSGQSTRIIQAGSCDSSCISLSDLNPCSVVVGLDIHFNILKLAYASVILQGNRAKASSSNGDKLPIFIATNEDPQIPVGSDSILVPGAGSMVKSLVVASGREPDEVCGKPNIGMAEILFASEKISEPKKTCLMVGDRLTTDIAFGNRAQCQTLLVLSGAEGLDDVAAAESANKKELLPDYIGDSLACLLSP